MSCDICSAASSNLKADITSSGFLTAGQNYSLTCSVNIPQSLNATITYYMWTINHALLSPTREIEVGTGSCLSFSPLRLSDSGQYVCTVNVTSDLLSSPLTVESDIFEVTIQSESLFSVNYSSVGSLPFVSQTLRPV